MAHYVDVPMRAMLDLLQACGFQRFEQARGPELVYYRKLDRDDRVMVKVYTSIRSGAANARSCGKDAIRIVTVFDDGRRTFGIKKLPRVYRAGTVEGVLERTRDRMREAYRVGLEWSRSNRVNPG